MNRDILFHWDWAAISMLAVCFGAQVSIERDVGDW
jgi:hypothetical protein